LGAERSVASEHARYTAAVIKKLKQSGWRIYAVEQAKGSVPYDKMDSRLRGNDKAKIALVLGNEVEGLPSRILALADKIIEIPMHGAKESLNVAVAFGIVAYHLKHAVLSRKK
jgi:tRNA G18 (ribose-2'-O)-methylase SpoU